MRFLGLAALLLTGCEVKLDGDSGLTTVPVPVDTQQSSGDSAPANDQDRDGYLTDEDCDDEDPAVNPGAAEAPYDGKDNDCDESTPDDDIDQDGYGIAADCDDYDDDVYPGAEETCDEEDNDCDKSVDEGVGTTYYADSDGDGYGELDGEPVNSCTELDGYVEDSSDCDDSNADVSPEATEVCDGADNDCNGETDEDGAEGMSLWYEDLDGDGFGNAEEIHQSCDAPEGHVDNDDDCDDGDAAVSPDADEICDGVDNDCDGLYDGEDDSVDSSSTTTWYADADEDGYGDPATSEEACSAPEGYVNNSDDCDDSDASAYLGATEYCDGVDNDCDTYADEDDAVDRSTWYADADSDTYGDPSSTLEACDQPAGYVDNSEDCDDSDSMQFPGADEYCNSEDDNCNGDVDEEGALDAPTWYVDADSDSYGSGSETIEQCNAALGYVANSDDCDDEDADINPGMMEACDGYDNDCDGLVDSEDDDIDPTTAVTWYLDADGDGYGGMGDMVETCTPPEGYVDNADDCDDEDPMLSPGAEEICDEIDNDCDLLVDADDDSVVGASWYFDLDGDGYGNPADMTYSCEEGVEGYVDNAEDCDDSTVDISPEVVEVCDEIDNDCDGETDEDDAADVVVWYADMDADGYGSAEETMASCWLPEGYSADSSDCDDSDPSISPDGSEVCDEIDNDCDELIDDADDSLDVSTGVTFYSDTDGDGFGSSLGDTIQSCEVQEGYSASSEDCDDTNDSTYPGADEYCDSVNNDCDDATDESGSVDAPIWYADTDGDGYGDLSEDVQICSMPAGYTDNSEDCDDSSAAINPGADEVCDDTDNDCDGLVDDADSSIDISTGMTFYRDSDGDSYGDPDDTREACSTPDGFVDNSEDCDDNYADVYPEADEVCDGYDNDCDGMVDGDDDDADLTTGSEYYADTDSDGYGDPDSSVSACGTPSGYVDNSGDCDDGDGAVHEGADEICDEVDNDCDGLVDSEDEDLDESTGYTWYIDEDGDGYGSADSTAVACLMADGYADNADDCDDSSADFSPDAEESCDGEDNDCDGVIDNDPVDGSWWPADADGDGYGSDVDEVWACEGVDNMLDCNDSDEYEPQVVDASADSSLSMGTYEYPWTTINDALLNAFECVVVYEGTYYEVLDYAGTDMSIVGAEGPADTILDGSGYSTPVVTFDSGEDSDAVFSGFTVTNGGGYMETSESSSNCYSDYTCYYYYYTYFGGGLYIEGANPTISDLIVMDNHLPDYSSSQSSYNYYYYASYGGGIFASDTTLDLDQVHLISNNADQGGGMYVDADADIFLSQAHVGTNTAGDGGGIEVDGGNLSLANVLFSWNQADETGGGVMAESAMVEMLNVTMGGNSAPTGGGLYLSGSCTFDMNNSIIYGASSGEGIYSTGSTTFTGTYSNVYGNAGGEYLGVTDPTGSYGNLSTEPRFVVVTDDGNPDNDDFSLRSSSPCVDAGDTGIMDLDGTRSDMGAWGGEFSDWQLP